MGVFDPERDSSESSSIRATNRENMRSYSESGRGPKRSEETRRKGVTTLALGSGVGVENITELERKGSEVFD